MNSVTAQYLDDVILPIRPEHAARLYAGKKLFELRRVIPREMPRRIFLYESDNGKEITGHLIVDRVLSGPLDELWARTGESATSRERFFAYFRGVAVGHAFQVATAVRYGAPVSKMEIAKLAPEFRAPQGFVYARRFPGLHAHLSSLASEASLGASYSGLSLRQLQTEEEKVFVRSVNKHITGSYEETGIRYARKLLQLNRQGFDAEGILTVRKRVLSIRLKTQLAGFVVLTDKFGGSTKTGPTILLDRFRGRGLGQVLRGLLHEVLLREGRRKVYCTVPLSKREAVGYLLGAGYRIEAHLNRQYHSGHDELVMGHLLHPGTSQAHESPQGVARIRRTRRLTKSDGRTVSFLQERFRREYCEVPEDWAARQISAAAAFTKGKGPMFKPRMIFAGLGGGVQAVGICALKRGGSAKLLVLARTAHIPSLVGFILAVERSVSRVRRKGIRRMRKIYTFCPVYRTSLLRALCVAGFRPEGLIERPYNPRTDVVVLAKSLSS